MLFTLIGICLGFLSALIPGFSSNNLSMLLITYGLISSNYLLAVTDVALEISNSFFGFLLPIIAGIGNEDTALIVDSVYARMSEESFRHEMNIIISGGLVGIIISLPLLFFAEKIYPIVYSSLNPILGWILSMLCIYMIWIERRWKKFFALIIFCLSGLLGLLVKNSGLIPTEYLLVPIFIGLYGFSSIISKKYEKIEAINEIGMMEKVRLISIVFLSSMFASLISGMKRGQASALALQLGNITQREEVLFILPAISLAFATLSIFVLFSIGKVRSTLAYDVQEIMGEIYFPQTVLFVGVIAVSACISAFVLILLAKPLGKILSKMNSKYLKILGFCIGCLLIINFTGIRGMLLAFTATCIGILSSRFHVRSTHLMGVLLLPSIVSMIL